MEESAISDIIAKCLQDILIEKEKLPLSEEEELEFNEIKAALVRVLYSAYRKGF